MEEHEFGQKYLQGYGNPDVPSLRLTLGVRTKVTHFAFVGYHPNAKVTLEKAPGENAPGSTKNKPMGGYHGTLRGQN